MTVRRKVFVSYHHGGDRDYYDTFVDLFADRYELVHDHSVDRMIGSEDPDYVIRRIREHYLTGASVTIVLCGRDTWGRKYVDWEILASLNQEMGLVGLVLPTCTVDDSPRFRIPARLRDNVETGYASLRYWGDIEDSPKELPIEIERALSRSKALIDNSRPKRLYNA